MCPLLYEGKQEILCLLNIAPENLKDFAHLTWINNKTRLKTDIVIRYRSDCCITESEFAREVTLWILSHVDDVPPVRRKPSALCCGRESRTLYHSNCPLRNYCCLSDNRLLCDLLAKMTAVRLPHWQMDE